MLLLVAFVNVAQAYDFYEVYDNGDTIWYRVYSKMDKTCEVTYNGIYPSDDSLRYTGTINIPEKVSYGSQTYTVVRIGIGAFECCDQLVEVTIPKTVTEIGGFAFDDCTRLKRVSLPSVVTYIGGCAFYGCTSLSDIGEWPESLKVIDYLAFYNTRINNLTIHGSLEVIGINVFAACSQLQTITVDDDNLWFTAEDNILFNKDKTCIVLYPGGLTKETYNVPEEVTKIGRYAFGYNTYLEEITMTSVDTIEDGAFLGCSSLSSIILPNSLKVISYDAFSRDPMLSSIDIPASVDSIEEAPFAYCVSLQSINVDENNAKYCDEDGVLYTKDKTILLCYPAAKEDTTYTVNVNCEKLYPFTFFDCNNLKEIILNEGLQSMEYSAFYDCDSLKYIYLPSSLEEGIDGDFLSSCPSLSTIDLSKDSPYYTVEDNVLFDKNMTQLIKYAPAKPDTVYTIPESVTFIGSEAFTFVQNLKKVVIPASVTEISSNAFDCSEDHLIDTIVCKSTTPAKAYYNSFKGEVDLRNHAVLVVPDGSKETYLATGTWNEFKTIITESEVTGINEIEADNTPASATTDEKIYDLQGRRLDMIPENGVLYIKDGKKYLGN